MLNQINIQDLVNIAKEAGKSIMQIYEEDFKVEYKQNNSPLTLADKKANKVIQEGLSNLNVNIPILSEEGKDYPFSDRKQWEYFWLVDPLDGTKEFIKKNHEFTVNIALIHKETPIIGVVFAPALDVCYWAKLGEGAYKNGQKLTINSKQNNKNFKIVTSRSHMSDQTQAYINEINTDRVKEFITIGSSLKICLVAEGEADIYPRLGPTMEWDTGAAHAIINESGKQLLGYKNGLYFKFKYNKENLLNPWFVVR